MPTVQRKRSMAPDVPRAKSASRNMRARRRAVAGGFVALPFTLSSLPGHADPVTHFVFARTAKTDENDGRTLFVASLPWASSAADVREAFGAESVELVSVGRTAEADAATLLETEGLHASARAEMALPPLFLAPALDHDALSAALRPKSSANVTFDSMAARDAALAHAKPRPWPTASESSPLSAHNVLRPSLDLVKRHADAWMAAFDAGPSAAVADDDDDEGELVEVVGDDGWTTVVRGGKHGRSRVATGAAQDADPLRYATGQTSVGVASRRFSLAATVGGAEAAAGVGGKKRKSKIIPGFYKFQRSESRQNDLRQAKRDWEQTKTELSRRRRDRRLKPY